MKAVSPDNPELIELLRKELGFSENAVMKQESTLRDNYPLRFDLIIEDNSKTYVVELKRIVRLEGLSQLGLLKLLLNTSDFSTYNTELVIVGKRITPEAAEAAEKIDIRFYQAACLYVPGRGPGKGQRIICEAHIPKILAGCLTSPQD